MHVGIGLYLDGEETLSILHVLNFQVLPSEHVERASALPTAPNCNKLSKRTFTDLRREHCLMEWDQRDSREIGYSLFWP